VIPIFLYGRDGARGLMFAEFYRRVLDICEEHRGAGRASAFAFILHDSRSPEVSKVLADVAYWRALDAIAGHALSVFAIHSMVLNGRGPYESPEERNAGGGARLVLARHFDLPEIRFPALLFFQVDGGQVSASLFVELRQPTVEASYLEIRALLELAAQAVIGEGREKEEGPAEAFSRIEKAIRGREQGELIRRGLKAAIAVAEYLRLVFA
jgi:hypothetical protein